MLYNILKDQWQTIEIDRIRSITQETEFSQMAELLYAFPHFQFSSVTLSMVIIFYIEYSYYYINVIPQVLHIISIFFLLWWCIDSWERILSPSSVYSTRHLSSAEDKNFPFCPQLRTRKTYGKQTLFSKPSTMAYLTMVVLPSWQLLTQY